MLSNTNNSKYWFVINSLAISSLIFAPVALAKGLDKLSEKNPETQKEQSSEEVGAESDAKVEEVEDKKTPEEQPAQQPAQPAATQMTKSATSQALAKKLFMSTSFGWVKASRSEGKWNGNKVVGMSDLRIGYLLPPKIGEKMQLFATYRYAPVAVSGEIDDRSFRGVWEAHYFGGEIHYAQSSGLVYVGDVELGYVVESLESVDEIPGDNVEKNGAAFSLGGGADWVIKDTYEFAAGPRFYAGFGSFTTIQLAGAIRLVF